jgi:hypothetical protein
MLRPPVIQQLLNFCQSPSCITTDSQSAILSWCYTLMWDPWPNFPLFFFNSFLDSYGFVDVGSPLWREVGSVLFSCCWTSPGQSVSHPNPARLVSVFYYLNFWDTPNLEGQVPIFMSFQEQRSKVMPTCGYTSQSKLSYDRRSVGQSVLVSGPHLRLMTRFLLLPDICGLHVKGQPSWREDASVIYLYN